MKDPHSANMEKFLKDLDEFLEERGYCPTKSTDGCKDGHWIRKVIKTTSGSACAIGGVCQETSVKALLNHMRHVEGWSYDSAEQVVTASNFCRSMIPLQ